MESFDKIISLGNACMPATQIRCKYFNDISTDGEFFNSKLFLSTEYPHGSFLFDWLQFPVESLIKVLESDLEGIFEIEHMEISKRLGTTRCVARNYKYGINFPHLTPPSKNALITRMVYKWYKDKPNPKYNRSAWDDFTEVYSEKKVKYDYLTKKTRGVFYSNMDVLFVLHDDKVLKSFEKGGCSFDLYVKLYDVLKKFPCNSKLLVTSASPQILEGNGKFDNIFFGSVEQQGVFSPDKDYKSWLSAMKDFQFKVLDNE